jgi:hypothetical protein
VCLPKYYCFRHIAKAAVFCKTAAFQVLAETKPDSPQEPGFVFFQGCLSIRPSSFARAALLLTIAKKTLYRSLVYILRQRIRPKPQSETDNSRNSHYDIDTGDDAPDGKSETEPLHRPTEKADECGQT